MRRLSISDSEVRNVKIFGLVTVALFMLCVSVFEFVFLRLGETLPYEDVVRRQQLNEELYYSPRYFNVGDIYKIYGVQSSKPEIIALGTSRIMPMEQKHIAGAKFYNAGVDASTSREIAGMLKILKSLDREAMPGGIVLGIDSWLFNPNYPANRQDWKSRMKSSLERIPVLAGFYAAYQFVAQRTKSYDMFIADKGSWFEYLFPAPQETGIGLNARMAQGGFRSDGSFHYPDSHKADNVREISEWRQWLARDQYRFTAAADIDPNALNNFKGLLEVYRTKNIKVVGVLLPFRGDFYSALTSVQPQAGFFEKFRKTIPSAMNAFGYPCYDFSSPEAMDLTTEDFWDNLHLKQTPFGKIMKRILVEFHDEPMINTVL